jgi:hypothetical protein
LVETGTLSVPFQASAAFGFPSEEIELIWEGQNMALLLVRKGLLQTNPDENLGDEYGRAQVDARGGKMGMWGEILSSERRADLVRRCGPCCRPDIPCEEEKTCVGRAKCYACVSRRENHDDREERYWRLSLGHPLAIGNRQWWQPHSIKVCLTVRNRCGQMCVNEDSIVDPRLRDFGCDYSSRDFDGATLLVLARPVGDEHDERIAEKQMSFAMKREALCQGVVFSDLVAKKDAVGPVFLGADSK